jgi:hypothetical protein
MVMAKSEPVLDQPGSLLKSAVLRRLLLVIVSLVFALFVIELPALFHLVDYKAVIGPLRGYYATIVYDPELLYIKRPHSSYAGQRRGGDITAGYRLPPSDMTLFHWDTKYDQNGCRNEHDLQKADMVAVGDSMVEGITVPTAELMTSLVGRAQGKVVANLGQSAYGPQQELASLKRFGLPLHPDTVLWVFSEASDLGDVVWYDALKRNPEGFWTSFYQRSFSRTAYKTFLLAFGSKRDGIRRSGVIDRSSGNHVTMYFLAPAAPLTTRDLGALDETVHIVAEAYQLSQAQKAHLIFVFAPDKFRVFHEFCSFSQASECRNWAANDLPQRMRKAITSIASDIGYVDLTPNLVDAVKQGQVPYYPDDAHWSPAGHKIAADTINEYLSTQKHIPAN